MSEQANPEAAAGIPKASGNIPDEKPGSIEIKVKDQHEGEMFFKIKIKTKLGKVFDAYCERQGLARNTIRFLFEGTRIQNEDTPEMLEMEAGDMIQAMAEQVGGDSDVAASGNAEVKAENPKLSNHISIRVKDQAGQEVVFRIKRSTQVSITLAITSTAILIYLSVQKGDCSLLQSPRDRSKVGTVLVRR